MKPSNASSKERMTSSKVTIRKVGPKSSQAKNLENEIERLKNLKNNLSQEVHSYSAAEKAMKEEI